jgi:hypothetical protein
MTIALGCVGARAGIVEGEPRVEVWTDRGTGGVYRVGEDVEIYIRADRDCYVIVYEVDTDGYLRLLFPYRCESDGFVAGGRVYRLRPGYHGRYYVSGPSGVEYVHALASVRPFRTLYWHGCIGYEDYAYDVSWHGFSDYWGCALPPRVYGDPYMAMQSIDEFICYDALDVGMAFADFTYFYVDKRVSYPRYVCYDCHGFGTHYRPYVHACTGFSISFIDCDPRWDPWSWWWWCTPTRVYCGPRYVCRAKRTCRDWPSEYKWKSRSDCYVSRAEYSDYWDKRVRTKTPRDVEVVDGRHKDKERDLYGRKPKHVDGHTDVAVRERGIEVIRPLDSRTRAVEKEKSQARIERGERNINRKPDRDKAVPVPAKVQKKEAKVREVPEKTEKTVTKRVAPKPKKEPRKVESKKPAKPAKEPKKAVRKAQVSNPGKRSSSGTKKVAPKVRTGSNKGKSPSKRRSLSK